MDTCSSVWIYVTLALRRENWVPLIWQAPDRVKGPCAVSSKRLQLSAATALRQEAQQDFPRSQEAGSHHCGLLSQSIFYLSEQNRQVWSLWTNHEACCWHGKALATYLINEKSNSYLLTTKAINRHSSLTTKIRFCFRRKLEFKAKDEMLKRS